MADSSMDDHGDDLDHLVGADQAVARWVAAMDAVGSVTTQSKFWMRSDLWQSASATITDSGSRFRIDGRNHIGDSSVTSMIAVDETAWVSNPHDPEDDDRSLRWILVPEGEVANAPRYREVFAVAHPYPSFSDPWRIVPRLHELPGFWVSGPQDGECTWSSAPLHGVPSFFRFGSVANAVFTATLTCDITDLPVQIAMRLTDATAPQKSLSWDIALANWGTTSKVHPPRPRRTSSHPSRRQRRVNPARREHPPVQQTGRSELDRAGSWSKRGPRIPIR